MTLVPRASTTSDAFNAVAEPRRREILEYLGPEERAVGDIAAALGLPYADVLERVGDNPPQREMENSAQQVANVRGEFRVAAAPPGGPGLLVDDLRYSGWTLATVGAQLRMKGAGPLHPLVLSLAGA